MSASALPTDIVIDNDTLVRTTVRGTSIPPAPPGSIRNGTITLRVGVFSMTASRGGTVVITGSSVSQNNHTFTIDSVTSSTQAHLVPAPFDTVAPLDDPFTSNTKVTVTRPGLLSDNESTGGPSIQAIVRAAIDKGLIPNDVNNLIYVFPSPDFSPDRCGASGPPAPDSHCDQVSGAYHASLSGLPTYAVLFGGTEPATRAGAGISHEVIEAMTNPDKDRSDANISWVRSDGSEASDVCCQAIDPGSCIQALGIGITSGVDNTYGGNCSPTGYIPSP
jgi:hypothetical protein